MKTPSLLVAMAVLAAAAQIWHLVVLAKLKRQAGSLRGQAKKQFLEAELSSSNAQYRFRGATAKVIREEEFGPMRGILSTKTDYTRTIYATNEAGECFVFKSSPSGSGTLKHVKPDVARAVLKDQYVAPHNNGG